MHAEGRRGLIAEGVVVLTVSGKIKNLCAFAPSRLKNFSQVDEEPA